MANGVTAMMSFKTIRKQTQDIISFGIGARLLNFIKGILTAFYIGANISAGVSWLSDRR